MKFYWILVGLCLVPAIIYAALYFVLWVVSLLGIHPSEGLWMNVGLGGLTIGGFGLLIGIGLALVGLAVEWLRKRSRSQ